MTIDTRTENNLAVKHLSKSYPTRTGELSILRRIDLELSASEGVAIMGPSGSGKSTLLHILGGLDVPSKGSVSVNGLDPFGLTEPKLARFRNETIGFVFQDHHLLPQCSVLENVLIPTLPAGGATSETQSRAEQLIEQVGLSERITHRPAELSGGERQRVAIARALMNRPALILCDEPTGNLDRGSADLVAELLLELFEENEAILIVVTHSTELAAKLPRRFHLRDGKLEEEG